MRCHRCDRPICPDCMQPASVGFQCPECVKEGARSVRTPRTSFGGRVAVDTSRVTQVLIGLNLAVFVYGLARNDLAVRFGNLALASDGSAQIGVAAGQYYRLLTAAFLHAGLLHIAFNMLALWQIGPYLESLLGRLRFLLLYLVSAVGGSAGVVLLASAPPEGATAGAIDEAYRSWFTGVVGASGAVFGLFGALLVLNRHLGRSTAGIGLTIAINGVFGFVFPGIAWQAHLGGLLTGLVCAGAIALLSAPGRRRLAIPAMLGVLVLVVAVTAVKYGTVAELYR